MGKTNPDDQTPDAALDRPPALAGVPDHWIDEALIGAVRARDVVQAAAGALSARRQSASSARDEALQKVLAGGDVEGLIAACGDLLTVERAAALVPAPASLTQTDAREALAEAASGLREALAKITVPVLAANQEVESWREHCRTTRKVYDPPQMTDSERALALELTSLQSQTEPWRSTIDTWFSTMRTSIADPCPLLVAAAELCAHADALATGIDKIRARVDALNADRVQRGLTWDPSPTVFLPPVPAA